MSGNRAGGLKAAKTNKDRYGDDFFKNIGTLGGKASMGSGFGLMKVGRDGLTGPQRAKKWGAVGGALSKKGRNKTKEV